MSKAKSSVYQADMICHGADRQGDLENELSDYFNREIYRLRAARPRAPAATCRCVAFQRAERTFDWQFERCPFDYQPCVSIDAKAGFGACRNRGFPCSDCSAE
jgi:hypothetical protein